MGSSIALADLRKSIDRIERAHGEPLSVWNERHRKHGALSCALSLGCPSVDQVFADGGLGFGAHQIAGCLGGAAGAFAALLLARLGRRHEGLRPPDAIHSQESPQALIVQERAALFESGCLYGPGLHALGVDPGQIGLIVARNEAQALRIADEALRSGSIAAVALELRRSTGLLDLSMTQRLNLAAQRSDYIALMLKPDLLGASAALSRWWIAPSPSRDPHGWVGPPAFQAELVRNRRGRLGCWSLEWSSDEQAFRTPASLSSSVASGPVHRSLATQARRRPSAPSAGPNRQGEGRITASGH